MSTIALPSVVPNSSKIEFLSNAKKHVSPFSGFTQVVDRGGERWMIDLVYRNLSGANRRAMTSFLVSLNGGENRFTTYNHAEDNGGAFGGTPLVNGADQVGVSIDVDGASLSISDWIRAGDFFGIGDELKMCTADTSSDGSGELTIPFRPRIRTSPADNSAVVTSQATGLFMLIDDSVSWTNRPGGFSDLSFRAIEDISQ